jgi:hypothetical protein
MNLIDSDEKLLKGPEIITGAVHNMPDMGVPLQSVLAVIAGETTLPNTDIVQVGNTVFLAQVGKGENQHKVVGRAFNMDTGRNFVKNGFKYFNYLQQKGYTHYSTTFDSLVFLNAFKIFQRRAKQQDTEIYIGVVTKGTAMDKYVVYMRLGKEPLTRGL